MFCFALKRPKKAPNPRTVDDYSEHMAPFIELLKTEKEWIFSQKLEDVEIKTFDGLTLKGYLIPAAAPSKKTVLAIHGYKSCGIHEYTAYIRHYHEMGFNVLLPDNRAHGRSEGKIIGFAWKDRRDCITWINSIIERFGKDSEILLHGISMGSATVMNASGEPDLPQQVKGIVSDCGYSSAWEEFTNVLHTSFHLHTFPTLYFANFINMLVCGYSFKQNNSAEQVKKAKVPFMFIHGGADDFVPTAMVYKVYEACASEQKELHVYEGAAHVESFYLNQEEYLKNLKAFIEKIGLNSDIHK